MSERIVYKHYRVPTFVVALYNGELPIDKVMASSVRYRKNTGDFVAAGRGGYTTCTITRNGKTVTGTAICGPKDNFCYKTGRQVAYERAVARLAAFTAKPKQL